MNFEKPYDKLKVIEITELMPVYSDIPDDFKSMNNPYVKWQQKWFFSGLKESDIPKTKNGIDSKKAIRHLSAIQNSWSPKHEHKEAGVAYLASLWFEEPKIERK